MCLKCTQIAEIVASLQKSGSRNTMVTSYFRPKVEIRFTHKKLCSRHSSSELQFHTENAVLLF